MSEPSVQVHQRGGRKSLDCRQQLFVHPRLQTYLLVRVLGMCTAVALATAAAYVGCDAYVRERAPTLFSLVPLLLAAMVVGPFVAWYTLRTSQRMTAAFVRLSAWLEQNAWRQAQSGTAGSLDDVPLRVRGGDPAAELVAEIARAALRLRTASNDATEKNSAEDAFANDTCGVSAGAIQATPPNDRPPH
ncbi:MAG: hypothetical protein KDA63_07350 [Planctomycetales bacterium]|nr:hypothetical protein [Planctomycetales bacterium]